MKEPPKSSELDPIPMNLLKEVIQELSPILTDQINTSLQQGTFPMELKKPLLQPLLKRPCWISWLKIILDQSPI